METIERKNRVRFLRGKISNFKDLTEKHQNDFITIKKVINKFLGDSTNVYVFGSFYWGFWDEFSDYDVLLDYKYNGFKIDERLDGVKKAIEVLKKQYGFKVDILTMQGEMGILIP